LYVAGGEDVVDFINDEVAAAEDAGALVVYTQDWHPASTPHFAKDGGNWPVHCVADTWGADFHSGLDVVGPSVRKGTEGEDGYSGFTVRDTATGVERPTGLEGLLRDQDITRVVVVGLATDYCVKETVLDALEAGFAVTVVADGIRAVEVTPGDGAKAVEEMAAAGAVIA
jgi:nicotinamidase/pyrazinamidase